MLASPSCVPSALDDSPAIEASFSLIFCDVNGVGVDCIAAAAGVDVAAGAISWDGDAAAAFIVCA